MDYHWQETQEIKTLLQKLDNQKEKLETEKKLPSLSLALRTKSLLRSAVFSARIEGFPDEENTPKKASQNLLKAYNLVHSNTLHSLKIETIRELHKIVMQSMSSSAGNYRIEPWAIFDTSGNAIYLAPMHFEVPELMENYIEFLKKQDSHPALVSALAQFAFEKIHPFADGNGRVGRLVSALVLAQRGYGFRGLVPFEKYIESHRSEYYRCLEPSKDATNFIEFFLTALTTEIDEVLSSIHNSSSNEQELLLPRRKEILNVITDHPLCTFDTIKRRFFAINPKTLHNDLLQLQKGGFIVKLGATRGVVYKKKSE